MRRPLSAPVYLTDALEAFGQTFQVDVTAVSYTEGVPVWMPITVGQSGSL